MNKDMLRKAEMFREDCLRHDIPRLATEVLPDGVEVEADLEYMPGLKLDIYRREDTPETMRSLIEVIKGIDDMTSANAEEIVLGWIKDNDLHMGNVMNAFRLTVVGECKGPHMFDIAELMGKDEIIARIERGIENIKPVVE